MRNYLIILTGILLTVNISAQEIEETDTASAGNSEAAIEISENVTEVPSAIEIAEEINVQDSVQFEQAEGIAVVDEKVILEATSEPFTETEYVIDTPEENNSFSGGIGFALYSFNMSPVRRLISARETEELTDVSNSLKIAGYDFLGEVSKSEAVPAFRTIFYGINENKFHVGGVLEVGGRTWQIQNANKDTVVMMGFLVAKAGILMEQVLVHNERNYLALGATLGGGGTAVGFFSRKGSNTFWNNSDDDNSMRSYDVDRKKYDDRDDDDDDDRIFGKKMLGAASGFAYLDVNLSYILSVSKHLHFRFDVMCDIMGSKNGYNLAGDSYGIVNPGGAFSLIWGSKQ